MPVRRSLLRPWTLGIVLASLSAGLPALAQQPGSADDLAARLAALKVAAPIELSWRMHQGDLPDEAAAAGLDDSGWEVRSGWDVPGSIAWFRAALTVPETVGDFRTDGAPLALDLGVDDDGRAYVDGQSRGDLHWDGTVRLTDAARPGQVIAVAVRVVNGPGPGGIRSAQLRLLPPGDGPAPGDFIAQLDFARLLAQQHAADHPEWGPLVAAARDRVQLPAAGPYDYGGLEGQVTQALESLAALEPVAKSYTIHYVGHAHIDMNWLWGWPETVQVCTDTFSSALRFMAADPEFRFSQSQCATYEAMREYHPDIYARIKQAIAAGQWEPTSAEWVETDHNLVTGEAYARELLYAGRYTREVLGHENPVLWAPDTFGHAWTIPSLAARAGLRYAYFNRCNVDSPLFWWEGPDGSRLLCAGGGRGWYSEAVGDAMGERPLWVESVVGLKRSLVVYGVGDHGGGPTQADLDAIHQQQRRRIWPTCRFSTAVEFFAACERDLQQPQAAGKPAAVPVWRGERNFAFSGCFTTHGDVKLRDRRLSHLLPAAETAMVVAGRANQATARRFEEAWRRVCFNQFHDLLAGTAIHDSYTYTHQLYDEAEATANDALDHALRRLVESVADPAAAALVFNPCAWPRGDLLTLDGAAAGPLQTASGAAVPTQPAADGRLLALVPEVPACGYTVLRPGSVEKAPVGAVTVAEAGGRIVLGHDLLTAAVDAASGSVVSLLYRPTGRELVAAGESLGALQMDLEDGGNAWEVGRIRGTRLLQQPVSVRVVERGPVRASVEATFSYGTSTFVQTISLVAGRPWVDFRLDADWQEHNGPDGRPFLRARFPLALQEPVASYEIPCGSIERPTNGIEVPALTWADLTAYDPLAADSHGRAAPVDLAALRNGNALVGPEGGGDFDGAGAAMPAEDAPAAGATVTGPSGIAYTWPNPAAPKDSVICTGQVITAPAGGMAGVGLLVSAASGLQVGTVELQCDAGSSVLRDVRVNDWVVRGGGDDQPVLTFPARHRLDGSRDQYQCVIGEIVLAADHGRTIRALRLPGNRSIRIFAATMVERAEAARGKARFGCTLLNDCKDGHSAEGSILRLSLLRCSSDPDPEPDQGRRTMRYRLIPHEADPQSIAASRAGLEFNQPLLVRAPATSAASAAGAAPAEFSFLRADPADIVVTAVKPAEDGDGIIVRGYEAAGRDTEATLTCGVALRSATECDLLERPVSGNRVRVEDGRVVRLPVKANEIITLRLRLAR